MRLLNLLVAATPALAFQLPFKVPFWQSNLGQDTELISAAPRIAIIGAGAGGSSAAFWLAKAKERFGLNLEVDIYESSSYVGGREYKLLRVFYCHIDINLGVGSTTVYPYGNTSYPAQELGASIFVSANRNLWRATDEFNLSRTNWKNNDESMGVWDGEKLLFSVSLHPSLMPVRLIANSSLVAAGGIPLS